MATYNANAPVSTNTDIKSFSLNVITPLISTPTFAYFSWSATVQKIATSRTSRPSTGQLYPRGVN